MNSDEPRRDIALLATNQYYSSMYLTAIGQSDSDGKCTLYLTDPQRQPPEMIDGRLSADV